MAAAAGKRKTKGPSLPSGFVYDLPSLEWPPHNAQSASSALQTDAITPCGSPASNAAPGNSSDLQLNLQIEKQQLEIHLLELEVQAKARSLMPSSSSKPPTIPLLDTVRTGINTGKSQGQLDHNTCILHPQEWPHLHVPFGLSRKNLKTFRPRSLFMVIWIF